MINHIQKQRNTKINSIVLERKTKSNCMIDLRIVCDRYVDSEGRADTRAQGHHMVNHGNRADTAH